MVESPPSLELSGKGMFVDGDVIYLKGKLGNLKMSANA
jgi:hypothetical protein